VIKIGVVGRTTLERKGHWNILGIMSGGEKWKKEPGGNRKVCRANRTRSYRCKDRGRMVPKNSPRDEKVP